MVRTATAAAAVSLMVAATWTASPRPPTRPAAPDPGPPSADGAPAARPRPGIRAPIVVRRSAAAAPVKIRGTGSLAYSAEGPNGKTFWYIGEYSRDNSVANPLAGWGTFIGSFEFKCSADDDDD